SYYGTNGINTWMTPFFGKTMYEDQAAYWDVSAIKYISQAKTPTLITVGGTGYRSAAHPVRRILERAEGDGRCHQPRHLS
ncbi:MAG: hypothetical protein ACTHOJ_08125, partial [Sphingomonas oligoaromativorans]